jgi:hypothetical protein
MMMSFAVHPMRLNWKQMGIGILLLFAGALEYLTGRPLDSTHLANAADLLSRFVTGLPDIYGGLGPYAPDFFHPLAFSLMCMAFFQSRQARAWSCVFWVSVNVVFELGQRNGIGMIASLCGYFERLPLLQLAARYFGNGTFDPYDLAAFCVGGLAAFALGELTSAKGGHYGFRQSARLARAERHPAPLG